MRSETKTKTGGCGLICGLIAFSIGLPLTVAGAVVVGTGYGVYKGIQGIHYLATAKDRLEAALGTNRFKYDMLEFLRKEYPYKKSLNRKGYLSFDVSRDQILFVKLDGRRFYAVLDANRNPVDNMQDPLTLYSINLSKKSDLKEKSYDIEHSISPDFISKLKNLVDYLTCAEKLYVEGYEILAEKERITGYLGQYVAESPIQKANNEIEPRVKRSNLRVKFTKNSFTLYTVELDNQSERQYTVIAKLKFNSEKDVVTFKKDSETFGSPVLTVVKTSDGIFHRIWIAGSLGCSQQTEYQLNQEEEE